MIANIEYLCDNEGKLVLVVVQDDYRKGRIWLVPPDWWDDDAVWTVMNVETAPAYRCQGIASALMNVLVSEFGAMEMKLTVAPDNEAARRIYTKFGFVDVGDTKMVRSPK